MINFSAVKFSDKLPEIKDVQSLRSEFLPKDPNLWHSSAHVTIPVWRLYLFMEDPDGDSNMLSPSELPEI